MTSETVDTATTAGESAASVDSNVETTSQDIQTKETTVPQGTELKASEQTPTYTPNYKYKAALQEKELDPLFHGIIKDAETEKKVKEVFTRADAFDFIKTKKEEIEQNYQSLNNDFQHQAQTVQKFNQAVQSNDLDSAFRLAGIKDDQLFKYVQKKLQIMEMPPEQRQEYDKFQQAQMQKTELEERVQQIQQQYEHQAVQARTMQLEFALNKPEVNSFAAAWDRNGEPGSFKNFVIEEAKKAYFTQGIDLSPEQAVQSVMQRFGKFLNVGDTTQPGTQSQNSMQVQQSKPVIPNITGKAASPIKKVPRSLDDLKKLAKSMD
jgi:hypothetical protein